MKEFWALKAPKALLLAAFSAFFFFLLPNIEDIPPAKPPIIPPTAAPIWPKAIPAVAPVAAPDKALPAVLDLPNLIPSKLLISLSKSPFEEDLTSGLGISGTDKLPATWVINPAAPWAIPTAPPTPPTEPNKPLPLACCIGLAAAVCCIIELIWEVLGILGCTVANWGCIGCIFWTWGVLNILLPPNPP